MSRRITGFLIAAALQLVALALAHELVFLARYGSRYGEALVHTGHGETWTAAVGSSVGIAVLLVSLGLFQLIRLGVLVRRRGASTSTTRGALEPGSLLSAWLRIAPRTAALSVVLLTVQENLERAASAGAALDPGILLSAAYPDGLWITIAVGLVVGFVAALFEWRRRLLLAKLRAARAAIPRGLGGAVRRPGIVVLPPVESVLGRRSALRAPPLVTAT